jgi:thiamine-phosphate pyrophosphorylase
MIQSQRNMNWRDQAGRLYAILDASCFSSAQLLFESAEELASAGLKVIQYRNKSADVRTILQQARELKVRIGLRTKLLMNDRSDLCLAAEFDGVHIGQDDLSPKSARKVVGLNRMLGVSTHNPEQVAEADQTSADYIAIGPVFATASKVNPDPIVGLAGVRRARELTSKPLIAIGGINRQNCLSVIEAGADSVAVISDLVRDTRKSAEEFLRILG